MWWVLLVLVFPISIVTRHFYRWPRKPDVTIGDPNHPYLKRWWVIPHNPIFNIYLHQFLKSDTDEALHDHPWWNMSLLLKGEYLEVIPKLAVRPEQYNWPNALKGVLHRPFRPVFRRAKSAHRVLLFKDILKNPVPCWSLFFTGPVIREWGFYCPNGWKHWKQFTVRDEAGNYVDGRGCD